MSSFWRWIFEHIPKKTIERIVEYYVMKEKLNEKDAELNSIKNLLIKQISENESMKEFVKKIKLEEQQKASQYLEKSTIKIPNEQ